MTTWEIFCAKWKVTDKEKDVLKWYLATYRMKKTLEDFS